MAFIPSSGGIPKNATQLPISGNDPTNTKTYIDTGLSGKQNISDMPKYKDYKNITLTANNSVLPFNHYVELDISDLSAHTVVALTLWGQSSYFPTTTTVGTQGDSFTSVRIYGYKNGSAPVTTNLRVYYI